MVDLRFDGVLHRHHAERVLELGDPVDERVEDLLDRACVRLGDVGPVENENPRFDALDNVVDLDGDAIDALWQSEYLGHPQCSSLYSTSSVPRN